MRKRMALHGVRSAAAKTIMFGSTVALVSAAVTFTVASHATASPSAPEAPTQLSAGQLPTDLVTAVRRDLHMSPEEYLQRAARAQELAGYAHDFHARHPQDFAGAWMSADGKATVAVTNQAAAHQVAANGYEIKMAAVSADGLDAALNQLTQWVGTLPANLASQVGGVGIDFLNNQLVIFLANTPVGQLLNLPTLIARIKVVLTPGGAGPVNRHPMGGDTYLTASHPLSTPQQVVTICSFGFNAVDAHGTPLNISAGHCDPSVGKEQRNAPVYIPDVHDITASPQAGSFTKSNLGENNGLDYSLITLNSRAVHSGMDQARVRGANGSTELVTGTADPVIGAPICKSGQTSAFTCGLITSNQVRTQLATDDGKERTVRGFATNACTLSGDSGGPIITGTLALGITSGSNASSAPDCQSANVGLVLDGGTASLGIPINRILTNANATAHGGVGTGLRLRTAH